MWNGLARKKWVFLFIGFFLVHGLAQWLPQGLTSWAYAETVHDFASWNGLMIQNGFETKLGYYLELQSRLNETIVNRNSFIIRPALRYLFMPQLSFWLGYGWMPRFSPLQIENRLWQQAMVQEDLGLWQVIGRFRLDERWLMGASGISFRGRVQFRVARSFDSSRNLSAIAWNELFYHLNTVEGGPSSGFDQSRIFVGLNFRLAGTVFLEPGYLNIWIHLSDPQPTLMSHAVAIYTIANF